MKIKKFIEQGAFSEKSPKDWSGEYVSNYLVQLGDAITEAMNENEIGKSISQDAEKIQRMTSTMNDVFGLVIDLVSNVPYSTLREVKLVNKEKMQMVDYAVSDLKDVSQRQNEITRMLDERIFQLNEALGKMNERLQ